MPFEAHIIELPKIQNRVKSQQSTPVRIWHHHFFAYISLNPNYCL